MQALTMCLNCGRPVSIYHHQLTTSTTSTTSTSTDNTSDTNCSSCSKSEQQQRMRLRSNNSCNMSGQSPAHSAPPIDTRDMIRQCPVAAAAAAAAPVTISHHHYTKSSLLSSIQLQLFYAILIMLISSSHMQHNAKTTQLNSAFASTLPATLSSRDHPSVHGVQPRGLVTTTAKHPAIRPPTINTRGHIHTKTTYACEGNQLDLTCDDKKSIHLVRANYGRFSLSICNDGGFSNLSVNCMSYRSYLVMQDRCSQQSNCSVVVSSSMFGDPCPDTSKYLEVQYYCVDATSANGSSSNGAAPQSTTSLPLTQSSSSSSINGTPSNQRNNVGNNNKPDTTLAITVITNNSSYDNTILTTSQNNNNNNNNNNKTPVKQSGAGAVVESPPDNMMIMSPIDKSSQSPTINNRPPPSDSQSNLANQIWPGSSTTTTTLTTSQQITNNNQELNDMTSQGGPFVATTNNRDFCQPIKTRHLYWNYTRRGFASTQKCPAGSIGRVEWHCDYTEVKFVPQSGPDYSDCKSIWLDNLETQLMMALFNRQHQHQQHYQNQQLNSIAKLTGELAMMTKTKELFSDDLRRISVVISQILTGFNQFNQAPSMNDNQQQQQPILEQQYLEQILVHVSETISGLLDSVQKYAWNELRSLDNRLAVANKLMDNLKDCALLFARHTRQDYKLIVAKQNVLVAVYVIDLNNRQQQLSINAQSGLKFPQADNWLELGAWSNYLDEDSIQVPAQVLADVASHGMARIAFIAFNRLEEYLRPDRFDNFQLLTATQAGQSSMVSLRSPVLGAFSSGPSNLDGTLDRGIVKSQLLPPLVQPITINFKNAHQAQQRCSPWPLMGAANSNNIAGQVANTNGNNNNGLPMAPFNSASSSSSCWLELSNTTSYICKCDHFSYFSLLSESVIGTNSILDGSTATIGNINSMMIADSMDNMNQYPQQTINNVVPGAANGQERLLNPDVASMPGLKQTATTTSWMMIVLILSVSVVVLFIILFLIGANSASLNPFNGLVTTNNKNTTGNQSRRFCGAIIGHGLNVASSSGNGGPTTGPIIPNSNNNVNNQASAAIAGTMGPNTTVNGTILGRQKQLSELASSNHINLSSTPTKLFHLYWLRPSYWLNRSKQHQHGVNTGLIHHTGVNPHLNQASNMSFKTHPFQNGYGISSNGHHHSVNHHTILGANRNHPHHLPMQAPSSSTSSYMSSSVYYEEIGPSTATTTTSTNGGGSLIPNPNHTLLANVASGQATKTTLVDLSKMPTTIINTSLLTDNNQRTLHPSSNNNNLIHSSWSASYALSPQQQQQQHQSVSAYGAARHHLFAASNPQQQMGNYQCRVYQPAGGDYMHRHL